MKEQDFIDLSLLDENLQLQEDGIEVDILGPTNQPTGLKITIFGPDSSKAQQAVKELTAEIEREAAREGNLDAETTEAQRLRSVAYLAKITKGWNKPVGSDKLQFSEDNAKALYAKYPIIYDQVKFRADRRGSFIKS